MAPCELNADNLFAMILSFLDFFLLSMFLVEVVAPNYASVEGIEVETSFVGSPNGIVLSVGIKSIASPVSLASHFLSSSSS